jgi:polyisoprenoid-binding protein YceI
MKVVKLALAIALISAPAAFGQDNPCNPCGGKKNACNPCGGMTAVNPCYAKMGTVFYIDDPMGRNTVTTTSVAPLEQIVGTSSKISGYVVLDPKSPQKGGKGMIMVPVKSLNTGIPLRDEHLQSPGWLNADANPNIQLHITGLRNVRETKSGASGTTWDVTLAGEFMMNGKKHSVEIPGVISYLPESDMTKARAAGNLLAARADFTVALADYGVTGPPGMDLIGSKVGETVDVNVQFVATSAMPKAMASNPCNPCGGKKNACNPCNPCGGDKKAANPCNPCGGL